MFKASLSKASRALYQGINALVVGLLAVMVVCICVQVFMRFVLGRSPSWSEELALLCFGWIVLLMLPAGVYRAFHVRMDLLIDQLPQGLRRAVERLVLLLTAGFGLYLGTSGIDYVGMTAISTSPAIGYPIYLLYGATPVSGFLTTWFALDRLLCGPALDDEQDPLLAAKEAP